MNTEIYIPISDETLSVLAASGQYLAELEDGTIVDLQEYFRQVQELSGLWKKIKNVFKKPLKLVGTIAGVGLLANVAGIGGGILGKIGGVVSKVGSSIGKITTSSSWTEINRIVRVGLQTAGILPTADNVGYVVQGLLDQQIADETGLTSDYNPYTSATTTIQSYMRQYSPLLIAVGIILVVLYLMRNKR